MIVLTNVTIIGNILEANYYLETNSDDQGFIRYDMKKHEIVDLRYCKEDLRSSVKYGKSKTVTAIEHMIAANKFPATYHYSWY